MEGDEEGYNQGGYQDEQRSEGSSGAEIPFNGRGMPQQRL